MELKPGFKQTEAGVIPEDWEVESLENITDSQRPISYGIVQTGPIIPHGVKCLRIVDIENGQINKDDLITTSQTISTTYKRTILRMGDLVMPLIAKVGDVALVDQDLCGANLTRGVALIAIRADMNALFFKQLISSVAVRNKLAKLMNGSALQEIPVATLRAFKIGFPPSLAEQSAIANALGDADTLIQSLASLIAKKRQIGRGVMQTLLNPYKNGQLQAGWVVKKLGNILRVRRGKSQHDVIDKNGQYPILATGGEIGRASKYLCDKPSVLIGRKGTIDVPQYMEHPFWPIDTLFYTEIFEPNNAKYLFYQFNLIDWRAHNEASGVPSLSARTIEHIEISIPCAEKQARIASILADMDAEIAALEAKLAKYRRIKQGMMQNLLTGRIRLAQPDSNAAAVA